MTILERIKIFFGELNSDTHNPHATENQNQEVYDALTPKIITNESMKEYFKALDFAFSRKM